MRYYIFFKSALISFVCFLTLLIKGATTAYANPYFFISADTALTSGEAQTFEVRVNTDGSQIGALQAVVNFSPDFFTTGSISISSSKCSIWTPANSAPPGQNLTRVTPYFYNNKVIIACGFTGSGYNGSDGLLASFTLTPTLAGQTTISFSNSYYSFLGATISPGAMESYAFTIDGDPAATPTPTDPTSPTPEATVTPNPTVTPTASVSATPTPIVNTTTLFSDVNVVDVSDNFKKSSSNTTNTSTSNPSELEVVKEDNSIPAPPNMTPRPKATPFQISSGGGGGGGGGSSGQQPGEVMSVQGLRDLLIPGRSKADKTVVLINFISTLTFLLLLAIVIWKMVMNKRGSNLKSQYIQELVAGELAALETKMEIIKEKSGPEKFEAEFNEAVEHIMDNIDPNAKDIDKK